MPEATVKKLSPERLDRLRLADNHISLMRGLFERPLVSLEYSEDQEKPGTVTTRRGTSRDIYEARRRLTIRGYADPFSRLYLPTGVSIYYMNPENVDGGNIPRSKEELHASFVNLGLKNLLTPQLFHVVDFFAQNPHSSRADAQAHLKSKGYGMSTSVVLKYIHRLNQFGELLIGSPILIKLGSLFSARYAVSKKAAELFNLSEPTKILGPPLSPIQLKLRNLFRRRSAIWHEDATDRLGLAPHDLNAARRGLNAHLTAVSAPYRVKNRQIGARSLLMAVPVPIPEDNLSAVTPPLDVKVLDEGEMASSLDYRFPDLQVKIIKKIGKKPGISIPKLALALSISERAVQSQLYYMRGTIAREKLPLIYYVPRYGLVLSPEFSERFGLPVQKELLPHFLTRRHAKVFKARIELPDVPRWQVAKSTGHTSHDVRDALKAIRNVIGHTHVDHTKASSWLHLPRDEVEEMAGQRAIVFEGKSWFPKQWIETTRQARATAPKIIANGDEPLPTNSPATNGVHEKIWRIVEAYASQNGSELPRMEQSQAALSNLPKDALAAVHAELQRRVSHSRQGITSPESDRTWSTKERIKNWGVALLSEHLVSRK